MCFIKFLLYPCTFFKTGAIFFGAVIYCFIFERIYEEFQFKNLPLIFKRILDS